MADKTIGSLDKLETLDREAKFAVESGGRSYYGTVGDLEDHATAAAKEYSESAKKSADTASEKAKDAADVAMHPPKIQDGNWWTWDTEQSNYMDSGVDAGVSLTIEETVTGNPGEPAKVENVGTATDPRLKFTIPLGNQGPVSSVNGKTGEVTLGAGDVGAYTQEETDTKIEEATARTWTATVPASAWAEASDTWGGIWSGWSATVEADGVTANTDIDLIKYTGGDRPSYDQVTSIDTVAGAIVMYAAGKPSADFSVKFTEVL